MEEKDKEEKQRIALVKRIMEQLNYSPSKMQARLIIRQIISLLRDSTPADEIILIPIKREKINKEENKMSKDLYGGFSKLKRAPKEGERKKFFCRDCGKWVEGLIIGKEGFILSKRVLCPLCGRCYLVTDIG